MTSKELKATGQFLLGILHKNGFQVSDLLWMIGNLNKIKEMINAEFQTDQKTS